MRRNSTDSFLVHSNAGLESGQKSFETGAIVPETGIYRVVHVAHRLPHEVVIRKGEHFPKCANCKDAVLFDLAHAAPDLFQSQQHRVYELPVVGEDLSTKIA